MGAGMAAGGGGGPDQQQARDGEQRPESDEKPHLGVTHVDGHCNPAAQGAGHHDQGAKVPTISSTHPTRVARVDTAGIHFPRSHTRYSEC